MRYSSTRQALGLALLSCFVTFAQNNDGIIAYKAGNFEVAVPLLRRAAAQSPQDAEAQAALLSSLVYEGKIEEASELDERDASAFAESPEMLAARGEFAFYMGDMGQAEKLFKSAIKLKEPTPRAVFGLSRVYRAASFYRTARLLCLRAHSIDPDDALITQSFIRYAAPTKRRELLEPFAASHPWLYKHYDQEESSSSEVRAAIGEKSLFERDGPPQETTLHFVSLMKDALHARGVGLELRINDSRPLRMLFDTGASGILVSQKAVDKAGLEHLGSGLSWGVGDKGTRNSFAAVANTCQVGVLKFNTCLIRALEGKGQIAGDEDGLIGADFFQDYVVDIDFQRHLLHLKPLPPRPLDPQGYDRVVPPDETGFTPVFRFGHAIFVTTKVNGKRSGLFLLDTGAEASNIDSSFASLSTKLSGNSMVRMRGISGDVAKVFEADKAELQFARFRQSNLGLLAFNLNNAPEHQDVRMAGILGLPVLAMFRLTIDYRNGLVNFDYTLK